jgi:hypothetical protein
MKLISKTEVSGHISCIIRDSFFKKEIALWRDVSKFLAVLYIQKKIYFSLSKCSQEGDFSEFQK